MQQTSTNPADIDIGHLRDDQNTVLEMVALGRALPEIFKAITLMIERQSPGTLCSILLLDEAGQRLRFGAAPTLPREYSTAIDGLEIGPMSGCCGAAAYLKQPVIVCDIATDPKWNAFRDLALGHGLRACWSVPILSAGGACLGTFALYARECRGPDPRHLRLLEIASHLASIAIEKDRTDQALRRSEDHLRLAIEGADLGTWDYNPLTGESNWSERSRAIWGIGPDAPVGYDLYFSSIHPEDRQRVQQTYAAALDPAGTGQWKVDYRIVRRDGSVRWVSTRARAYFGQCNGQRRAMRLIGTVRDITEQKQAEEALQASERRYRALAEKSWEGTCVLSAAGIILYAGPGIIRWLGYTPEEMTGNSVFAYFHADDIEQLSEAFREVIENHTSLTKEFRFRHKNGSWRWIQATWTNHLEDPSVNGIIANYHDITQRREVEEQLRASERFREQVLTTSPNLIYVYDLIEQRNVYVNKNIGTFLGYTQEQIHEMGPGVLSRLLHPDDHWVVEAMPRELEPLQDGEAIEHEYRARHADGQWRWFRDRKTTFSRTPEGKPRQILGVAMDITTRKQALEMVERERAFLRKVIDTTPGLIFVKDWEGRFLLANQGLAECYGTSIEGIIDKTDADFSPNAEEVAQFRRDDQEVMTTRRSKLIPEERVTYANGEVHWLTTIKVPLIEDDGTCNKVLGVATDITDRKRMEEALRQSQEKFQIMAETVPAILFTSLPDGTIDFVSQGALEITGLPREAVQNWQWTALLHPDDARWVIERWKHALSTGQPFEGEYRLRAVDGFYHWFVGRARPIRNAQAQITKWFGVVTDITETKQFEQQLKQAKDDAESANRCKDQFLAVLSHELRTPLTPVLAAAQMMERNHKAPPELRESATMVRRNVELEARLIDDLLDLTRISRGKLELHLASVDLHEKLWHVMEICDHDLHAKQLRLTVEFDATEHQVRGDSARLQQVLWNLLRNAIKFTPPRGKIILRTENRNGHILTSITDTGIGIEPELLPRIFSAFEQGGKEITRQFGGLGLGLAISKGLVDMHGGRLTASSPGKGQGATFTLDLPVLRPQTLQPPKPQPPAPLVTKGARILLVEDHPDTAKTLAMLLKSYGLEVRTAPSQAAALKAAQAEDFDLVISDIGLPDGSGLELMRQLKARRPLKGIALSGYGMEEDLRKSREAGFQAHLIKPVDLDRLEQLLRQLLA